MSAILHFNKTRLATKQILKKFQSEIKLEEFKAYVCLTNLTYIVALYILYHI